MQEVLHQLLLVVGAWEGTVIKHLGTSQRVWQWQLQGGCVPRGVTATTCGIWLQCPLFFCQTMNLLGPQAEPTHRPPVVAGHASLWPRRRPPQSVPAACRSHKRHHVALSPLLPSAHTRGAWPPAACTRNAQSPVARAYGFLPSIACINAALPSESPSMQGEIPMVVRPSSSPTMASCFSFGPRPSPGFPVLWHSSSSLYHTAPPPVAHCSLAPQISGA